MSEGAFTRVDIERIVGSLREHAAHPLADGYYLVRVDPRRLGWLIRQEMESNTAERWRRDEEALRRQGDRR